MVKKEEGGAEEVFSPALCGAAKDGDGGKELLRHLLKDKTSHIMALPTSHAPPAACRQSSHESIHSEEEDRPCSHGNIVRRGWVNGVQTEVCVVKTRVCVPVRRTVLSCWTPGTSCSAAGDWLGRRKTDLPRKTRDARRRMRSCCCAAPPPSPS